MLNQVVLVGRLTKPVVTKELKNGKIMSEIELAVQRSFKNSDGEYEADIIPVVLWNNIAESSANLIRENDLIGIKARLKSNEGKLEIIAEKITFLSSSARSEAK